MKRKEKIKQEKLTWKIPGIVFVDIRLFDEFKTDGLFLYLSPKIK